MTDSRLTIPNSQGKSVLTTQAMIITIFSFLPGTKVAKVSEVCKAWKTASKSEPLWQVLLKQDEQSLVLPIPFSKAAHGSSQFFYSHGKLMLNKIRCDAIKLYRKACIEHSYRRGHSLNANLEDFVTLPDDFFLAYHQKLIPAVLVTGTSPYGAMDHKSIEYMDNPNLQRIKHIFDKHALTLLKDPSLNQTVLQDIIYQLATRTEWMIAKYERAFDCLDLGRQVFLNENHKIFDLIPDRFIEKLDGKIFANILQKINTERPAKSVIESICREQVNENKKSSCVLM